MMDGTCRSVRVQCEREGERVGSEWSGDRRTQVIEPRLPHLSTSATVAPTRADLHKNGPDSTETADLGVPPGAGPRML
jgi:hypothetical protein